MKKLIVICEIFVVAALIIKIVTFGGLIGKMDRDEGYFEVHNAVAGASEANREHPYVRDAVTDRLEKERELLTILIKKRMELTEREGLIAEEEERLTSLKDEIVAHIEALTATKEEITTLIKSVQVVDDKQYRDLAKVYEATPPDQAGEMLTRLDKKTAAAIIMRMKSKSAGQVWGHIDPATAADITKEITRFSPPSDELTQ